MPLNDLHLINYPDKPKFFISSTLIIIFKQRKGKGGPT